VLGVTSGPVLSSPRQTAAFARLQQIARRCSTTDSKPTVVVMGVSGCGKTTVGRAVAAQLQVEFIDGDVFHPQSNVDKMHSGTPLTDQDRQPWLEAISEWLADHVDRGAVVGCSALRRRYRDILRRGASQAAFLHLEGEPSVVQKRIEERKGHFMPPSLLRSQFDTLERLAPDEYGVAISLDQSVDDITGEFLGWLAHHPEPPQSTTGPD
jgi:gluconokinase